MERCNIGMDVKNRIYLITGAILASVVLVLMGAVPSQLDFDTTYFNTNALPMTLAGNLTNWSKLTTNTAVSINFLSDGTIPVFKNGILSNSPLAVVDDVARIASLPFGLQSSFSSTPQSSDCYLTNIYTTNAAAGVVDIFTVPAGFRLIPLRIALNVSTSSFAHLGVKTNGISYRMTSSGGVSTNTSAFSWVGNFILEQNETLYFSTTATIYRSVVWGLLFTNTIPLKTYRLYGLSSGDNTLFTCSSGKKPIAILLPGATGPQLTLGVFNSLLSGIVVTVYQVPNGAPVDQTTRVSMTSLGATAPTSYLLNPMLNSGDSIVVNVDTGATNQVAWITLVGAE